MEQLLKNASDAHRTIGHYVSKASFVLVEKFSQMQSPPLELLASCVRNLSLVAKRKPLFVWEKLSETGIFPFVAKSHLLTGNNTINPGLVGLLLAQQECVMGRYPLTSAFLDLLSACVRKKVKKGDHPTTSSLMYVIHDIFPAFQNWGFNDVGERERFGQKILQVCLQVLKESECKDLKGQLCRSLMTPAASNTLIEISSTGDRAIQSLSLAQSNVETGVGVELSRLVSLALHTLDILLSEASPEDETLKSVVNASGSSPHFLLTVAHYIYHLQSCDVPIAAVKVLTTFARLFPMSMLACWGPDAEAVREIFVNRLDSKTEDILLKIAIVDFFTACVETQPGLTQLLLAIKDDILMKDVNENSGPECKRSLTEDEKKNESVELIGEGGCLSVIADILKDLKGKAADKLMDDLHISVVDFTYNLWSHNRIVAVTYLKNQPEFWGNLMQPLFDKYFVTKAKLNGCILRIVSSEIYIYGLKLDKNLSTLLEKFFDENHPFLKDWCDLVINELPSSTNAMDLDVSVLSVPPETKEREVIFLLGSWKTFLIVMAKDMQVGVTPKQCHLIVSCLIKAIRKQLSSGRPITKITTSLAETCLVLMRRWQTKCSDKNMDKFIVDLASMLQEMSQSFTELPIRSKTAILSIVGTAIKFSTFKLDHEFEALSSLLIPVAMIVQQNTLLDPQSRDQVPMLTLGILRNLLARFSDESDDCGHVWFPVLHERAVIQTVLSITHHSLRAKNRVDLIQSAMAVLLVISRSKLGSNALLNNDLSQLLWLPLSTIKNSSKGWINVFTMAMHLASNLLRVGSNQLWNRQYRSPPCYRIRSTASSYLPETTFSRTTCT